MRTRIKICCMKSLVEAEAAVGVGADAIGLVGVVPPTPRVVTEGVAVEIVRSVPPPVATFLLTSETRADDIAAHVHRIGASVVQVVKHIKPSEYSRLDARLPRGGVKRVQVVHVEGRAALELIEPYAPHVDAFLLDSGRPSAETPDFGGTGRIHDWHVSAEFVQRSPLPVFLAGGLTPDNVGRAIETVRPYAVDLCNGVRTGGALDEGKLVAFFRAVGAADVRLQPAKDART
jgi:phosphoribosylanthranilate isomerase